MQTNMHGFLLKDNLFLRKIDKNFIIDVYHVSVLIPMVRRISLAYTVAVKGVY